MLRYSTTLTTGLLALALMILLPSSSQGQDLSKDKSPQLTPAVAEQFCVDDRAVNTRLAHFGGQLIDANKTTPIEELMQQLKRSQPRLPGWRKIVQRLARFSLA